MSAVLIVFAKRPVAGRVKTRLCPPFTPAQAADFYAAMLADVLAASAAFAARHGVALWLAVDPPAAVADFARLLSADAAPPADLRVATSTAPASSPASASSPAPAPAPVRVVAQRGEALGERMERAVADAFAAGAAKVLLRSSDSPGLSAARLATALAALGPAAQLALCPDQGGGYVLAGLSRPAPGLFAHRMSTASVLDETLARARRRGLSHALLPASFDVDVAADVARLRALSAPDELANAARSRAWLASHQYD